MLACQHVSLRAGGVRCTREDELLLAGVGLNCAPLWTANLGDGTSSSPAVANGVVYVGADGGAMYGFDAAGVSGCSGTPKTCSPRWFTNFADGGDAMGSSPAVAERMVFVGGADGRLHAFGL